MKHLITALFLLSTVLAAVAQSPVGVWKTIDDKDGKVKSHINITEVDGKLYGSIAKLIDPEREVCTACKGDKQNQPLIGMQILWDLKSDGDQEWSGGSILDPKNGKTYKCKVELVSETELNVRGFIGFSLLGRTQTWYRVAE